MTPAELKALIAEVGAEIQPKLAALPGHSKRNAYAHIYGAVRDLCGDTYSLADPMKVVAIVEAIRRNPNATYEELVTDAGI
jgi:hypothetical protein